MLGGVLVLTGTGGCMPKKATVDPGAGILGSRSGGDSITDVLSGALGVGDAFEEPIWVVERFEEAEGWQGTLHAPGEWGERLAGLINQGLIDRGMRAQLAERKLSDAEIEGLLAAGIRYLCDGSLSSLTFEPGAGGGTTVRLGVQYRLQRELGGELGPVQKRMLRVETAAPSGVPIEGAAAHELLDALTGSAAKQIVDLLIEEIPNDILAERG